MEPRNAFSITVLTIVLLPLIIAGFLPGAIQESIKGNTGLGWLGFSLAGFFFMAGVAFLVSAVPHLRNEGAAVHKTEER